MIVEAALYVDGIRECSGPLSEVAAEAAHCPGFVWAGLHNPDRAEIEEVGRVFGLHPLAIEDAIETDQRPKVERYGEWLFVVLRTARYLDEPEVIEFGEIQVMCSPKAIVVIRHGEPVPLDGVRLQMEQNPESLLEGPIEVLHAVVDSVVDAYDAVLAGLDDDVSEVELQVFSDHLGGNSAKLTERMYFLHREVLDLHRAVHPLVAAMPSLRTDQLVRQKPRWDAYFRDVADHTQRAADRIQTLREIIAAALAANATQVSLRQNEDMRKISAWVAIAAIPTMLAGIYGMNFRSMPELNSEFGYPIILTIMATVCLSLYGYFRKSGWL